MQEKIEDKYRWFKDNMSMYIADFEDVVYRDLDNPKLSSYLYDIYYYFNEMYQDEDKRFFMKFYDTFMMRYSNENCRYRNAIFRNRGYYSFFVNLCMIMYTYKVHKDNYSNFEAVVDEVFNYDICYDSLDWLKEYGNLVCALLAMSESVIERKNFKYMDNLRELFRRIIYTFNVPSEFFEVVAKWNTLNDIDRSFHNLVDNSKEKVDLNLVDNILDIVLGDKENKYFCSDILFFGNRFWYLNNRLYEVEDNDFLRKNIFKEICKLHPLMFFIDGSDKFEYYMDIVFDSDSYKELVLKLDLLNKAGYEYMLVGDRDILNKLDQLKGQKDSFRDQEVVYPVDMRSINPIAKPKKIVERMKESYALIDDRINYDFIDQLHLVAMSLVGFNEAFDYTIKHGSFEEEKQEDSVPKEKKKSFFAFLEK